LPGIALELPSEARWEYACRAGTTTSYHFGSRISHKFVRYGHSTSAGPVEVGSFPPNAWGLHEMHGNIWEWCEDDWHPNYHGAPHDGSAWTNPIPRAARRVLRGGSWISVAQNVRAAFRLWFDPGVRSVDFGFRCVRGPSVSESELAAPAAPARGQTRNLAGDAGAATRRRGGR